MKIKPTEDRNQKSEVGDPASGIRSLSSERGIALILTLILLSVTLVMAIAFLAISRREQGSVTTSTDTATARLAADSALANAEAQIIANMLSTTNPYSFGLLVSTNYINTNGFASGFVNPTNVSYNYANGNPLTSADLQQNIANLFYLPRVPVFIVTNQQTGATEFRFYLDLNRNGEFEDSGSVLETNNLGQPTGNTVFEVGDPQWVGVLERPDTAHGPNNKFLARYAFIALPAGNALDLNTIHNQAMTRTVNPNPTASVSDGYFRNQGVGSWEINLAAFLTDLNTNEWDTTVAPYNYFEPSFPNTGFAFQDALSLLSYRYDYAYNSLATIQNLFGANGQTALASDNIDEFSDGPLMTTTVLPLDDDNADMTAVSPRNSWVGADNTNHFFNMQELFDPTKTSGGATGGFTNRLLNAGVITPSTYDRYTFYRLLAQLDTDSTPESGKINLNYDNLRTNANGVASVTNFIPWTALGFFTNAADRMLRLYTANWFQGSPSDYYTNYTTVTNWIYIDPSNYLANYYGIHTNYFSYIDEQGHHIWNAPNGVGLTNLLGIPNVLGLTNDTIPAFGITNIPVFVNGQFVYSSAVNRLLQLAANIYDATTNNTFALGADFPNVFRPFFNKVIISTGANVYIGGFNEVTDINEADLPLSRPYDLNNQGPPGSFSLTDLITTGPNHINVFGVPLIVGAKKGFPNFNQFAMQNVFFLVRELQITRTDTNALPSTFQINQQFQCGITNQLEVELWNSYGSNYMRPVNIYVMNYLTMTLTNDEGFTGTKSMIISASTNLPSGWSGYDPNSFVSSIQMPLNTNVTFLPGAVYVFNATSPNFVFSGGSPNFTTNLSAPFETSVHVFPPAYTPSYPQPHWWLIVTNNIQVAMVDTESTPNRLIDYVQLSGPNSTRDVTAEILNNTNYYPVWSTNLAKATSFTPSGLPVGVYNEIYEWGEDYSLTGSTFWKNTPQTLAQYQIDGLRNFYRGKLNSAGKYQDWLGDPVNQQDFGATNLQFGVTMNPAIIVRRTSWQANDPLVHYIASDLNDTANDTNASINIQNPLIGTVVPNERYQPWGITSQMSQKVSPDSSQYNLALKDSSATNSDAWDFPANKFPTVGWLGRIHRGTPWQTVYLKASNILHENVGTNSWINWTGNGNTFDAANAAPIQDRLLFDLFTTAPDDNATRGQLSVNVGAPNGSSFAAWSALFSGMVVPTNFVGGYTVIQPAGVNGLNSPLGDLVTNINNMRAVFTNADGVVGTFEHQGDILSTLALTEQSPFLAGLNPQTQISDELYEWLPQQAMSLLRCPTSPRYVIYTYGQALKPAPNGIVTSGGFFGMITNYQVVSESAARAVIRVEGANTKTPHIVIESYNILPPD